MHSDKLFGLFQASSDQTNIDILVPFVLNLTVAMYITLLSIIIITCQYAWPTAFLLIPLGWLNFWYRVMLHFSLFILVITKEKSKSQS